MRESAGDPNIPGDAWHARARSLALRALCGHNCGADVVVRVGCNRRDPCSNSTPRAPFLAEGPRSMQLRRSARPSARAPCRPGFGLSRCEVGRGLRGVEALEDALRQLYVLDAIDADGVITPLGRRMASLPLDPSLARAVIEAVSTPRISACQSTLPVAWRPLSGWRRRRSWGARTRCAPWRRCCQRSAYSRPCPRGSTGSNTPATLRRASPSPCWHWTRSAWVTTSC